MSLLKRTFAGALVCNAISATVREVLGSPEADEHVWVLYTGRPLPDRRL